MKESTWAQVEELFLRLPMLRAEAVPRQEVDAASVDLGCVFSDDYSDFVARYGSGVVGPDPIFGLRAAEVMGVDAWSVIEMTRRFRAEERRGVSDWYVISTDGLGNPVGADRSGVILLSDFDSGEVLKVADSFEDFVLRQLSLSATG